MMSRSNIFREKSGESISISGRLAAARFLFLAMESLGIGCVRQFPPWPGRLWIQLFGFSWWRAALSITPNQAGLDSNGERSGNETGVMSPLVDATRRAELQAFAGIAHQHPDMSPPKLSAECPAPS